MSTSVLFRCRASRRLPAACAAVLAASAACAAPLSLSVVDAAGRPLPDAVVYVLAKGQPAQAAVGATAEIAQRDKQFQPQVTVVQAGTAVFFPNFDTVRHHVYSFSPTRTFELKLYAGTPAVPVVFDRAGSAAIGCNVHDRMAAWVHVVDTPLFTKTDAQGQAALDVPPGAHLLRAWHPQFADTRPPLQQPLQMGSAPLRLTLTLADAR